MSDQYRVQANREAQTILRRRVRKEDTVLPVLSTASLAPAGRVMIGNEELVTYTGFGTDVVGEPTLTGCTRGTNREQGGSGPRDWPGGTFVVQAPYERPELVSAIPDATVDQAGRQVYLEEQEPELSFYAEGGAASSRRDLTTPEQWNAPYLGEWGSEGSGNGEFTDGIRGIAVRPDTGDVYVSSGTGTSSKIQKFSANGTYLSTIAAYGTGNGQVDTPGGMAFNLLTGNFWVADSENERRIEFTAAGSYVSHQNNPGSHILEVYYRHSSGIVSAVEYPTTGAFELPDNQLQWFSDNLNSQVYFYSLGANTILAATLGSERGKVSAPTDLVGDAQGNIYVTDSGNHRVQVFDSAGIFQGMFGRPGSADGHFDTPTGIAITDEYIYVCDSGNSRVQIFSNPVAPTLGEVIALPFHCSGGTNSSAVTYLATLNENVVLPAGTWEITTMWSQTFTGATAGTWQATGKIIAPVESTPVAVQSTTTGRSSLYQQSQGDVVSDGVTATNFRVGFVRSAYAVNPAAEGGSVIAICKRVA